MASRFFHTLVVAGAALSASCGGKSETDGDLGTGATGGSSSAGSAGASSSAGHAGTTAIGGAGGATSTGGTPSSGGATMGGAAGGVAVGGAGGSGGAYTPPQPGTEAQWDCEGIAMANYCVDVGNTTAAVLEKDCPVDASRPKTAMDCEQGQLFTCYLAQKADGQLALVNCECQPVEYGCSCTGIGTYYYGEPTVCDDVHKICGCAYTGILK